MKAPPKLKALVCVPTYDNEKTIGDVISALTTAGHTVLCVNDGSNDDTEARARAAGALIERHPRNRGKGEALKTGFRWARAHGYTHVLTIDGDGQHEPADAPALLSAAEAAPDALVLGVRPLEAIPPKNRFGNRVSNFWVNLAMRTRFSDTQCGLRVYPTSSLDEVAFRGHGYELETEALIRHVRNGRTIVPVPVRVYYPEERVSHFVPWRDATRIVFLVMRFLFLPRPLWAALLILAACAHERAAAPVLQPASTSADARTRALQQTALPFTAAQHLRYSDGKQRREADALFVVYPGRGYRLRVLGPMMVTAFDVSVRCGRYFLEARQERRGGPLSEADASTPFFPVRALEQALQPLGEGEWRGDIFVSKAGVVARLEAGREVFSELEVGGELRVRVLEDQRIDGVMMPKRLRVELSGGRVLDIDNTEMGLDAPREEEALGAVICNAPENKG